MYTSHSLVGTRLGSQAERRYMWGESPTSEEDIYDVFDRFVRGRVPRLPWCENIEGETAEAGLLRPLCALNHNGFLTINSQPALNGVPSTHPSYGWGPADGRVFQKAYLEFFCSEHNMGRLTDAIGGHPTLSLMAHKADGSTKYILSSGKAPSEGRVVTAVTWGVFDGRDIMQPTIVDSDSFNVWTEEAFAMWHSAWAAIYPEGSASRALVESIHDTYWHACIVDNDYVGGDIFKIFAQILNLNPRDGTPVIRPIKGPAAGEGTAGGSKNKNTSMSGQD
jgi:methylenetetrahydrofolate reductase (NADPH)